MKILLMFLLLTASVNTNACSMFKITENGKTVVGNNEDYYNPVTKVWFRAGKEGQFGVVNFGFGNDFAQGAMNEAGLMFDGFAMEYLAVNDTAGKLLISNTEYIPYIMHNFSNVREVKEYMSTINLGHLRNSMYLFVDKTGEYLVVEGDSLIIGNDPMFTLSNFYPSQTADIDAVRIPFFQNGREFLRKNESSSDVSFCSEMMSNLHQDITQYTSIYDLSSGTIKLHHFHDYTNEVVFNISEELAKGDHEYYIPELFPKDSEGYQYFLEYTTDANAITNKIGAKWAAAQEQFDKETLASLAVEVESLLNTIGYEWLRRGEIEGAITIFKYNSELFPKALNTFDSLAEAYMTNQQYDLSIENYKKAIRLNEHNPATKEASKLMLQKVKKLKKSN